MSFEMLPFRRHSLSRSDSLLGDPFFRSFFDLGEMMGSAGFRVDIREKEDAYELACELPGAEPDAIDITCENNVLTVSAKLDSEDRRETEGLLYSERRVGSFRRSFSLEGVRQEDITAAYRNGVLTVTLPKAAPAPRPAARKIAIGE